MAPAPHLQKANRRGDAHREHHDDAYNDPGLLAWRTGTADPQFVVVPEVPAVHQVAPRGEYRAGDQGMVGENV
jgi:hypothetical protein